MQAQRYITSSKAVSMVTFKRPLFMICRKLLVTFSSWGINTSLGSGDHQRMGEPSAYHGKIPIEYASRRRFSLRSPPTASRPSPSAYSGGGKALLSDSKKTGIKDQTIIESYV